MCKSNAKINPSGNIPCKSLANAGVAALHHMTSNDDAASFAINSYLAVLFEDPHAPLMVFDFGSVPQFVWSIDHSMEKHQNGSDQLN